MKKMLIVSLLSLPLFVFAEKTTDRKPASIQQELVQAQLKVADVLSRARLEDKICEVEAYQTQIIHALSSVEHFQGFNPSQISNSVHQALDGVISFKEIAQKKQLSNQSTKADFEQVLVNSYWETPGMGVYGSLQNIRLKAGGVVEVVNREPLEEAPWIKEVKSKGQWAVQVKKEGYVPVIRVVLKINGKTQALRMDKEYGFMSGGMWTLGTKRTDSKERSVRFYNYSASECEA